jgi:hypothetical protein
MSALTLFGLFAVSAMLVCYALESRSHWFVLLFAVSCTFGSAYGFLQGAWPFGLVEATSSAVALRRWFRRACPLFVSAVRLPALEQGRRGPRPQGRPDHGEAQAVGHGKGPVGAEAVPLPSRGQSRDHRAASGRRRLHGLKVRGAVAWWLWGAAHILFLVGGRNWSAVLLDWVGAYLTYRRGSRLITDRPTS